jgi:hypothetical protein
VTGITEVPRMKIIGINGFKRSGKGETANAVFDRHPGIVYEVGFSDKLKIMAAQSLGFEGTPRELIALMDEAKIDWDLQVIKEIMPAGQVTGRGVWHDLTFREYLQNLGTRCRELFGADFWVDQVLPRPATWSPDPGEDAQSIEALLNQNTLQGMYPDVEVLTIADLRFPNEAKRVHALGGVVWEIVRPGVESDGNASEQPLPRELVTRTIVNDGTLEQLAEKVQVAMKEDNLV